MLIFGFNLAHKTAGAVQQAMYHEQLELETLFAIGIFITFLTGLTMLLGPLLKAVETVQLLSTLEQPLDFPGNGLLVEITN